MVPAALGLAVAGGLLLYAAFPPLDIGVLGFLAVAPLVALGRLLARSHPRPGRAGLRYGLIAGLCFFGPLVIWLTPFGFVAFGLLVAVQAAYIAVFVGLVAAYGERRWRPAVVAALWVGLEALRAVWPLGGFGWGVLGYTQHDGGLALGAARTLGVYGVSLLLVAVAVAVEEIVSTTITSRPQVRGAEVPGDAAFTAIRTPLLTALALLTAAVLLAGEPPDPTGRSVDIGIAQAGDTRATSAAGVARLDSGRIERVAQLALEATRPFAVDPPDLVVWPENSLDIDVRTERGAPIRALLDEALEAVAPAPILAGEYRAGPRPRTLFNQMTVFTLDGMGEAYVKRQPVPFGEYVPGRHLLGWFAPLQQIPNDTLRGGAAQVIEVAGARVGAVICFENTFPGLVFDQVRAGADLLVVGTNNSSFGVSPMSAQHLMFSRLRAVETGRWVVHAGISGISGFVDPEGRVHQQTALFEAASPRMEVPLVEELTPAVRVGGLVPRLAQLLAAAALGLAAWDALRRRHRVRRGDGGAHPPRT